MPELRWHAGVARLRFWGFSGTGATRASARSITRRWEVGRAAGTGGRRGAYEVRETPGALATLRERRTISRYTGRQNTCYAASHATRHSSREDRYRPSADTHQL